MIDRCLGDDPTPVDNSRLGVKHTQKRQQADEVERQKLVATQVGRSQAETMGNACGVQAASMPLINSLMASIQMSYTAARNRLPCHHTSADMQPAMGLHWRIVGYK